MKKQLFLKVMDLIKKQKEFNDSFEKVIGEVDGGCPAIQLDKYTDEALWAIIEDTMSGDAVDVLQEWIYYGLEEYGKKNPMKIEINGNDVKITSLKMLYDKFLVDYIKEQK